MEQSPESLFTLNSASRPQYKLENGDDPINILKVTPDAPALVNTADNAQRQQPDGPPAEETEPEDENVGDIEVYSQLNPEQIALIGRDIGFLSFANEKGILSCFFNKGMHRNALMQHKNYFGMQHMSNEQAWEQIIGGLIEFTREKGIKFIEFYHNADSIQIKTLKELALDLLHRLPESNQRTKIELILSKVDEFGLPQTLRRYVLVKVADNDYAIFKLPPVTVAEHLARKSL